MLILEREFGRVCISRSLLIQGKTRFLLTLLIFGLVGSGVKFVGVTSSILYAINLTMIYAFLPLTMVATTTAILVITRLCALSVPVTKITIVLFLLVCVFCFQFAPRGD